jgi:D-alanyl-lipoteichoic acid acyltransferase DltB (MBOAT superfamily)
MSFTSLDFLLFFLILFILYWLRSERRWQNSLLLAGSYVFYGWVHPWYALMLGASTLADHVLARRIVERPEGTRRYVALSLAINLGVLAFFKYYNFFSPAVMSALQNAGVRAESLLLQIALPLGLSFYTLKKLSYILDVSKGALKPVPLADLALYASFFPQIAAGPIDRAQKLLPQIEAPRLWRPELFYGAWPLLVMGFFKKIVVADSISVIVGQIFSMRQPGGLLVLAGSLAFTLQILADFSAYTDLARGTALLLGFETSENFRQPYLSLTPTDFWNRWHITLSTWLRDYVFFPVRRALLRARVRLPEPLMISIPPLVTMFASGLWHGAGWTFVVWGLYYGVLIAGYQLLGIRGDWKPATAWGRGLAWLVMFALIVFGWAIFRSPSLGWLGQALFATAFVRSGQDGIVALIALCMAAFYALPLLVKWGLDRVPQESWLQAAYFALTSVATVVYLNSASPDFIYFQF